MDTGLAIARGVADVQGDQVLVPVPDGLAHPNGGHDGHREGTIGVEAPHGSFRPDASNGHLGVGALLLAAFQWKAKEVKP